MKVIGFVLFVCVLYLNLTAGCQTANFGTKESSEKLTSQTRDVFGFREIKAGNSVNLIISVQKDFDVAVEGDENLLKDVKTEVKGETLVITTGTKISPTNKIRVKISMPELLNLELWGATEATVTNVKTDSLKIQAAGTSKIKIDGEIKNLEAEVIGASAIDAENLKTENAATKLTGTSELIVSATGELTVEAIGASTVYYTVEPKSIKKTIVGTSEVRKK